jgi:hypothetical protein
LVQLNVYGVVRDQDRRPLYELYLHAWREGTASQYRHSRRAVMLHLTFRNTAQRRVESLKRSPGIVFAVTISGKTACPAGPP